LRKYEESVIINIDFDVASLPPSEKKNPIADAYEKTSPLGFGRSIERKN